MLWLRLLTADDLPLVWRLKQQAGWNQTPEDLERFLALAGDGWFVAELDRVPVGTVATFEFGDVAWIAMMLVDPQYRGRGIGRALMNQALEHLDGRGIGTIRLDATPLGRPLYETLGFKPQFELARYAGIVSDAAIGDHAIPCPIEMALPHDLEAICRFDQAVTRTDRQSLLARLWEEQPGEFRVARGNGALAGFMASRPGANARQIGPCLAEAAAGPSLFQDALDRHAGEPVFIDIPLAHAAATEIAVSRGLSPQRTLTRMCRGAEVCEDLTRLWASSSPEKG